MSIKDFSSTVIQRIMKSMSDKVTKTIENGVEKINYFDPDLRTITGKDQIGVMSQRGIELLAGQFGRATEIASTREKLIKQNIKEYEKYKTLYLYLTSQQDSDGISVKLQKLSGKAFELFTKGNILTDFLTYYTATFGPVKKYTDQSGSVVTGFTADTQKHRQFNDRFIDFLISSKKADAVLAEFIDANTDAGHLLGVFNIKLAVLFDLQITPSSSGRSFTVSGGAFRDFEGPLAEKDRQDVEILNTAFQQSLELLADADFITGNLLSDMQIDIDAAKRVYGNLGGTSAVEGQISYLNTKAGRQLTGIAIQLKKLQEIAYQASLKQAGSTSMSSSEREFKKQFKTVFDRYQKLQKYIESTAQFLTSGDFLTEVEKAIVADISKRSSQIFTDLMESSGSDSIVVSIDKTVFNPLRGLFTPQEQVTIVPTISQNLGKSIKRKKVPKLKKPVNKSSTATKRKQKTVQIIEPSTINLPMLMMQINSNLANQIKANMGTGNSRNVLNYRTGRFAESAKVERLSESRQGMITAFYSYMKNPYATFSRGGRQEFPRSRDPKSLISKSIRELAGSMIANRLRAVNV